MEFESTYVPKYHRFTISVHCRIMLPGQRILEVRLLLMLNGSTPRQQDPGDAILVLDKVMVNG